jgi:hypothetical protein
MKILIAADKKFAEKTNALINQYGRLREQGVAEGLNEDLQADDGEYYSNSDNFFSQFESDWFDNEETSPDGMEIRGYIDGVNVMAWRFKSAKKVGGWGIYDDSALRQGVAEGSEDPQSELKLINQKLKDAYKQVRNNSSVSIGWYMSEVKALKARREELIKQLRQGVAEEASPMIKPPSNRFDNKQEAFAYARQHGGRVFKSTYTDPNTGMKNTTFVVKKEQGVAESATEGSTSAGHVATLGMNPKLSPGPARGKKSYIGTPGKSGTKAPPQPKVNQPKTKHGTAVNALDMKSNIFGGGKAIKRK